MLTFEKIEETAAFLRGIGIESIDVAIVLGTGLGRMVEKIAITQEIPYEDIPNFPVSTVEFHSGKLIYGSLKGKRVLAMQGRFHSYEGYSGAEVTFPIRVMKAMDASYLLLSNAAGCIHPDYCKGELMLIEDHINLQGGSPLTGLSDPRFGQRFVDLFAPYDARLNALLQSAANALNIQLREGVYSCVAGPHLETRAEYRFLSTIGADAVGMSTVPEVIVANQIGLPCAAISVLTDNCDPTRLRPVNIEEIIAIAGKAEPKLVALFTEVIGKI